MKVRGIGGILGALVLTWGCRPQRLPTHPASAPAPEAEMAVWRGHRDATFALTTAVTEVKTAYLGLKGLKGSSPLNGQIADLAAKLDDAGATIVDDSTDIPDFPVYSAEPPKMATKRARLVQDANDALYEVDEVGQAMNRIEGKLSASDQQTVGSVIQNLNEAGDDLAKAIRDAGGKVAASPDE